LSACGSQTQKSFPSARAATRWLWRALRPLRQTQGERSFTATPAAMRCGSWCGWITPL